MPATAPLVQQPTEIAVAEPVQGETLPTTTILSRLTGVGSRTWLRRLHALVGVVSSLNLLLLLATGFLLQHRETFGLEERTISRRWLSANYRPQDGSAGVRADIVVADLHSGRMFGRTGALVFDALTLVWLVLLVSGLMVYGLNRLKKENGSARNGNGTG